MKIKMLEKNLYELYKILEKHIEQRMCYGLSLFVLL